MYCGYSPPPQRLFKISPLEGLGIGHPHLVDVLTWVTWIFGSRHDGIIGCDQNLLLPSLL